MSKKNFGFIRTERGGEYFFHRDEFHGHWRDLEQDYERGVPIPVEFENIDESPRGPRAQGVRRTDFPNY